MTRELALELTAEKFNAFKAAYPDLNELEVTFTLDEKQYLGIYSKDLSYNADNGGWHFSFLLVP
jgi:hypothetical protein